MHAAHDYMHRGIREVYIITTIISLFFNYFNCAHRIMRGRVERERERHGDDKYARTDSQTCTHKYCAKICHEYIFVATPFQRRCEVDSRQARNVNYEMMKRMLAPMRVYREWHCNWCVFTTICVYEFHYSPFTC